MKSVTILGATGSIGGSALDVIARHPQRLSASVLAAGRNVDALVASDGRTTIADVVVSKIAGIATREVNGVHAVGGGATRAIGALRERKVVKLDTAPDPRLLQHVTAALRAPAPTPPPEIQPAS